MFEVHITASSYEFDDEGETTSENHGWIIPSWSMTEIYPTDEKPEGEKFDTHQEALDYIESEIGSVDTNDSSRGNYYAEDSKNVDGVNYSYAGHIKEIK